jgi:predicted acyltransferase
VSAFVLLGYWALLALVPAPDAAGLSSFSMGGSVDRMLLPGVLHDSVHDPEGILSTFPAAVTALIGILVGDYVKAQRGACGTKSVLLMLLAAAVLLVVGCLWDGVPDKQEFVEQLFCVRCRRLFGGSFCSLLLCDRCERVAWVRPVFPCYRP